MTERRARRAKFQADMIEVVRREIPEELDWLRLDKLPDLRWADDGTAVDGVVQRGWLAAACARGTPRADAGLHRQAQLLERESAAGLGRWLVQAWIEHDTDVPVLSNARREELRATAEQAAELARRFGRSGTDPDERFDQLIQQEGNRAAPTALPYRGLLAIVEACADDTIVDEVEAYRARHSRERPEQSRLLSETLRALSQRPARE